MESKQIVIQYAKDLSLPSCTFVFLWLENSLQEPITSGAAKAISAIFKKMSKLSNSAMVWYDPYHPDDVFFSDTIKIVLESPEVEGAIFEPYPVFYQFFEDNNQLKESFELVWNSTGCLELFPVLNNEQGLIKLADSVRPFSTWVKEDWLKDILARHKELPQSGYVGLNPFADKTRWNIVKDTGIVLTKVRYHDEGIELSMMTDYECAVEEIVKNFESVGYKCKLEQMPKRSSK